jgi:hypothetical protein
MSSKLERGISSVNERIKRSRNRVVSLTDENRLGNLSEIWEAYYDVEEAILISKIVFGGFDKPGKSRKLKVPTDFDFSKLNDSEIRAEFESIENNLSLAESKLEIRSGEEMIEYLRRARDQLKIMLLHPEKPSRRVCRSRRKKG